jgi:phosphate transport system substrate-binding protein
MKNKNIVFIIMSGLLLVMMGIGNITTAHGEQALKFSCSAQLYDILQPRILDTFTQNTNIGLELSVVSSEAALYRLYNNVSDVAGTAERLHFSNTDFGYVETPVCKAPIVVITHRSTKTMNVTTDQLRDIFSGKTANWKELGGDDHGIVVVVPDKGTAAYRNFSKLALKRFDIGYNIMTYRSTMVVQVVEHVPGSISFVTKGSDARDANIKILKVDGVAHTDRAYPYQQHFSLVTRGRLTGSIKTFVDYMTSEQTAGALRANGIFP